MNTSPIPFNEGTRRSKRITRLGLTLLVLAFALPLTGCAFPEVPQPSPGPQQEARTVAPPRERYAGRPPINPTRNLYEGSLWRGAASWGNLLRDHRARYRGDLLTVTELTKIINVPKPKPQTAQPNQPQAQQQAAQAPKEPTDPVLRFLREQEKRREQIDREQNEILRSIETMEVEVVRVMRNGNLLVRGVHPPIFRDRNRVKYIVTLQGIVRPSDVDANNQVLATKLSKAEYRIRRYVKRRLPPIGDVARAAGRPSQGALADRLAEFLTAPGTGARNTQVSPK